MRPDYDPRVEYWPTRPIKFRAWSQSQKRMIPWCELRQMQVWEFENADLGLMQYTGIDDKDGEEIYEGDIVEAEITEEPLGTKSVHRGIVIWYNDIHAKFALEIRHNLESIGIEFGSPCLDFGSPNLPLPEVGMKVVGNVFESDIPIKCHGAIPVCSKCGKKYPNMRKEKLEP